MELTRSDSMASRPLRAGIVGGGRGAFIGAVHRLAVELDGQARIVAGNLSSNPDVALESAQDWFLDRSYNDYQEMAREEAARPDGIDFVIIVTPNHLHAEVAEAFIKAGIHVMCEKPLALNVEEAQKLEALLVDHPVLFALAHTYNGYPAVREARDLVSKGKLGDIRKVQVEYNQDWLSTSLEAGESANKQASWRTDPAKAGISCCVGDIGTHAANLLEYISGQSISEICADLTTFVEGRLLDDDANMLFRLSGGGKGTLVCSQIACGEENALNIRVYGTRASLEWHQQEPNTLWLKPAGQPHQKLRTGVHLQSSEALQLTRTPGGHPEGYLEAMANLYKLFIADVRRRAEAQPAQGGYPGIKEGLRGMQFIQAAVDSSAQSGWVSMP